MNIVKGSKFDIKKVSLTDIVVNKYGGKNIYLNYGDVKKPVFVRLTNLKMPFPANVYKDENNPNAEPKYSIVLSFNNLETDSSEKKCYEMLKQIDNLLIEEGVKNSKKWFKKKKSRVQVEENYNSIIRQDDEKKWAPKFGKINLRYTTHNSEDSSDVRRVLNCKFYDQNKQRIEIDDITKFKRGTEIKGLIRCNGIYFAGSKFGLSWTLEQARVEFPMQLDVCRVDDTDDEDDETQFKDTKTEELVSESESESDSDSD